MNILTHHIEVVIEKRIDSDEVRQLALVSTRAHARTRTRSHTRTRGSIEAGRHGRCEVEEARRMNGVLAPR